MKTQQSTVFVQNYMHYIEHLCVSFNSNPVGLHGKIQINVPCNARCVIQTLCSAQFAWIDTHKCSFQCMKHHTNIVSVLWQRTLRVFVRHFMHYMKHLCVFLHVNQAKHTVWMLFNALNGIPWPSHLVDFL